MQRESVRLPLIAEPSLGLSPSSRFGVAVAAHVLRSAALALLLLSAVLMRPAAVHADLLEGYVVGQDGEPKAYVRVNIIGPQKRTVVTDEDGRFTVDLLAGRYTVRVTDNRRRMDFRGISPGGRKEFPLKW